MMKIKHIILLCIALIMTACQCPTDIDTPRIIEPDNATNLLFINATAQGDLDIYSSDILIYSKLKYAEATYSYKKAQAGVDLLMIKINSTDKNIINVPIDLKKNDYYTVIFYDISSIVNFMLLSDNYTANTIKTHLRLINSSVIYPHLLFQIESGDNLISNDLNMLTNTAFLEANSGNYHINVIETESQKIIAKIDNFEFKQGSAYSIIFRTNTSIPDLFIVEHSKN